MEEENLHTSEVEDLTRSFEATLFNEKARSMYVETSVNCDVLVNLYDNLIIPDTGRCKTIMGSKADGTSLQLPDSDLDILVYTDFIEADPSKCMDHKTSNEPYLCMVKNKTTPTGYTKLQIYQTGKPAKSSPRIEMHCFFKSYSLKVDNNHNCFVRNTNKLTAPDQRLNIHGPAVTQTQETRSPTDYVRAFPCKDLPEELTLWFQRERRYGWPSPETLELFKKMGCFVVAVGHLKSSEQDLQWRISFSYQERHLMLNLNPTQYKCYILLKLVKKFCLKAFGAGDVISSYHCKTALFYTIENNSQNIWRPDNLSNCTLLCLKQLYEWVGRNICPNYFIPEENMFETKLSDKQQGENVQTALNIVFYSYLGILKSFIHGMLPLPKGLTVEARVMETNARHMRIQLTCLSGYVSVAKPLFATNIKKVISYLKDFIDRMDTISHLLICKEQVTTFQPFTEKTLMLLLNEPSLVLDESNIDILCSRKNTILRMFVHTKQHIHSKIACLFLARFVQETGNELLNSLEAMRYRKDALKVDSFQYYVKTASVFFKKGQYRRCREILTKSTEMVLPIQVNCHCPYGHRKKSFYQGKVYEKRLIHSLKTTLTSDMNAEELLYKIPTCLIFDTLEMSMVSMPLTFEGYRSFGIPRTTVKHDLYDSWCDWVVIDPKVYLHFLQYKNDNLLDDTGAANRALDKLEDIIQDGIWCDTVVHLETALNALGHIYVTKGWYKLALHCFKQSWVIRPLHNAAKWHVMFMLFAKKYRCDRRNSTVIGSQDKMLCLGLRYLVIR